ncbi:hypothetical protein [Dyella silvatica]|uniref:hypothetical protein n=1 Tax=Dyella silvatica TaxID=2992128 RepID=UPI0022573CC9|nr:hypothetical protein [Dyella silvatica]
MARSIDNTQDVIDSRDVISRVEELEVELEDFHERGGFMNEFDDWIEQSRDNSEPVYAVFPDEGAEVIELIEELYALRALTEEAEHTADWTHGEVLIREDYFTDYIEELVKDCYEVPKDMDSDKWPWCHMAMDWEAAAEAAKVDYNEVTFDGEPYLIRA